MAMPNEVHAALNARILSLSRAAEKMREKANKLEERAEEIVEFLYASSSLSSSSVHAPATGGYEPSDDEDLTCVPLHPRRNETTRVE